MIYNYVGSSVLYDVDIVLGVMDFRTHILHSTVTNPSQSTPQTVTSNQSIQINQSNKRIHQQRVHAFPPPPNVRIALKLIVNRKIYSYERSLSSTPR